MFLHFRLMFRLLCNLTRLFIAIIHYSLHALWRHLAVTFAIMNINVPPPVIQHSRNKGTLIECDCDDMRMTSRMR